jgi:peptidoglycan hydrolase-like protein with peptidoglycan-binding domain
VLTDRVDVGVEIQPGEVLWEIDGAPTVVLPGDGALFRTLSSGVDDGADVARLEAALRALGFTAGGSLTVDEEFDAATTAAIKAWQASLGVDDTGSVDPSDAVFLPGSVRVTGASVDIGGSVGSSSEILTVASVTPTMHITAPVAGERALTAGQRLTLDIGDTSTTGTVFAVSRDVTTDTDAGTSTVEVIVAFDDPAGVTSLVDGTTVVATILVDRGEGLTVPVGALHADERGRPIVTVIGPDGDRDVVVTPGVSGGGTAVVSGDLDEGDQLRLV